MSELPHLDLGEAPFGKRVASRVYVHASAIELFPEQFQQAFASACEVAGLGNDSFNVVRFAADGTVALLHYQAFFDDGFPTLVASWNVDLGRGTVSSRSYAQDRNPPILHRKEMLLGPDHPRFTEFHALTSRAEELGLFEETESIGTRLVWQAPLSRLGLAVRGNAIVEQDPQKNTDCATVHRHRTALQRYALSTPMQALWRHGYLVPDNDVFDYGCGRGDDVRMLAELGLTASGWDPHFAPDPERRAANVVNLGFVINVIENLEERAAALRAAFQLARRVLAVAALISSDG